MKQSFILQMLSIAPCVESVQLFRLQNFSKLTITANVWDNLQVNVTDGVEMTQVIFITQASTAILYPLDYQHG